MKPDLQTRIVDVLKAHGAQPARDMPKWLTDVDSIALDCGLSALIRANKVVLSASTYSLPGHSIVPVSKDVCASVPSVIASTTTTAEPATLVCLDCRIPKADCEFRLLPDGKRANRCNTCHGKRSRAGVIAAEERRAKRHVPISTDYTTRGEVMKPPASAAQGAEVGHLNTPQRDGSGAEPQGPEAQATRPVAAPIVFHSAQREDLPVNGSGGVEMQTRDREKSYRDETQEVPVPACTSGRSAPPAATIQQPVTPRERGDNRDVSTERCQDAAAVPETSGSYSRSDPRQDARTPASPDIASPRIADRVFERVKAQREEELNKIALLQVEIANLQSAVAERDKFLELYERFAERPV